MSEPLTDIPLKIDDEISVVAATKFIAEKLHVMIGDERSEQSKIRNRIVYAIKHGKLPCYTDKKVKFGELITWGLTINDWKLALSGLPSSNQGQASISLPSFHVKAIATFLPSSLIDCHDALIQANIRLNACLEEAAEFRKELEGLRQIAEREEIKRKKNVESSKLKRSPR